MVKTQSEGPVTKVNVGRLTNAIFVFTLLLLFRNVKTPTFESYSMIGNATTNVYGYMQLGDIFSFLNAFIVLAMLWIVMFHIFHQLQKTDRTFLYLHLMTLLMIIFIPITSHLNVVFPDQSVFPVIFNLNMLIIGLLLFSEWFHISRKPEIRLPLIGSCQMNCTGLKMLYIPITAVFGVVLSTFDLKHTQSVYLITMIAFALTTLYFRNRKISEGSQSV